MHKSTGNAIEVNDAIERMGADVMRWMYSEQVPSQNLNFGYGPAHEIKRRLLTLWNSVKFFVDYANVSPDAEAGELDPLDRWLRSRAEQLVAEATDAYERYWTPDVVAAFEAFVDDLSNWYIRRSRRRFWNGEAAALATLRSALTRSLVVIAPVMPFLAEHLWHVLREEDQPESIFLARWEEAGERDEQLLAEVAATRRVVDLGRQARAASGLKLRQPLRRLVVEGAPIVSGHVDEIRDELRVKEVELGDVQATELRVKPNLPVLGPKLGKELGAVRAALEAGDFEELPGDGFRAAGHNLSAEEVLVERTGKEGWAVAGADGVTVALDTALDAELELEGRVLDLIHELNSMRKEAGLELTDRIVVSLPEAASELLAHEQWIKEEVLAVEIRTDGGSGKLEIAKA
jgi:isoleucyl-tRNA synthetase